MKYLILVLLIFIIYFKTLFSAFSDEWQAPTSKEIYSNSRHYSLIIEPGTYQTNHQQQPGPCKAKLYKIINENKKEVWSRFLINNVAPVQTFITDSGEFVVTMDEWHHIGKLPLVIYGKDGRLIRVHNFESLGINQHLWHQIEVSASSRHWNKDALIFFKPEENILIIRLHWGKILMIDLISGNILDQLTIILNQYDEIKIRAFVNKKIRMLAFDLLNSKDPYERRKGAIICGTECITESIPRLRKLLLDKENYLLKKGDNGPSFTFYFVRKEAKEALELMGEKVENIVIEEPILNSSK